MSDRIDELEQTVDELESTVTGLINELLETKERINELETELHPEEPSNEDEDSSPDTSETEIIIA